MNHEDYQKAINHWKSKDKDSKKMERGKLFSSIEEYINKNNTCVLATGYGTFIRCTPLEYSYHDHCFFIFTEGGEKFIGLEHNKNVCLAIYDKYSSFASLKGLQVMGNAEIVEPFSEEYVKAAEYKKIPLEALKKLPEAMNLIKIIPVRIDFLNSDFKKEGCDARQELILK
jgi:uncharacterized protein YhbP (UPF0306 family)